MAKHPLSIRFDKKHHDFFEKVREDGRTAAWFVIRAVDKAIEEEKRKGHTFAVNLDDKSAQP